MIERGTQKLVPFSDEVRLLTPSHFPRKKPLICAKRCDLKLKYLTHFLVGREEVPTSERTTICRSWRGATEFKLTSTQITATSSTLSSAIELGLGQLRIFHPRLVFRTRSRDRQRSEARPSGRFVSSSSSQDLARIFAIRLTPFS